MNELTDKEKSIKEIITDDFLFRLEAIIDTIGDADEEVYQFLEWLKYTHNEK